MAKAEALAAAKKRIVELQAQMTGKILQMAAEIQKLLHEVSAKEAKEFLRVTCNVPAAELKTYAGYGEVLRGREDVLTKSRVSFPVLKALVAADNETRNEVLERMEIGARIDDTQISSIRRQLKNAKLTPRDLEIACAARLSRAAAKRHGMVAADGLKERIDEFVRGLMKVKVHERLNQQAIRLASQEMLEEFQGAWRRSFVPVGAKASM